MNSQQYSVALNVIGYACANLKNISIIVRKGGFFSLNVLMEIYSTGTNWYKFKFYNIWMYFIFSFSTNFTSINAIYYVFNNEI